MIHRLHEFDLAFRVVGQYNLERPQHGHSPRRSLAKYVTDAGFQRAHLDQLVFLRHAGAFHELSQRCGRVATPAHARDCRHARIVPSGHNTFVNERLELAFARNRVGKIQPRKFDLARTVLGLQLVKEPIVKRSMILELERAQ